MKKAILFCFLLNFCSINIIHAQLFGWLIISSNASSLPIITTTAVNTIYSTTASSGGVIVSAGNSEITAKGVVYSTTPLPTIALTTKTNNGTGTNTFTSTITGLQKETTYYLRAYATNSYGRTSYGDEISFTTLALSIGDAYQGGIIFYILQPGGSVNKETTSVINYDPNVVHGLIAANTMSSAQFNNVKNGVGPTGSRRAIGDGLKNTLDLISLNPGFPLFAASEARLFRGDGYEDWYLPSKDEMANIYINRSFFNGISGSSKNFWTSSDKGYKLEGYLYTWGGNADLAPRSSNGYVVYVRSF